MTKLNINGIKAFIFDMDGTMVNNMLFHRKAWKQFSKEHNFELTDEIYKNTLSGKKNNFIIPFILKEDLSSEEIDKLGKEKEKLYRQIYAPEIKEVEGLNKLIKKLKQNNFRLAIATTANQENREFVLKYLNLEGAFEAILGDEDVEKGKPDPEIYLKTAEKLGINPSDCIVFEDSPPGVASAKAANMKVVVLLTTHQREDFDNADYFIHNFNEVEI